ncbi:MAG: zinc-dependent metalloprotease [Acidobacteria bacterium]|nr:zinc-dependent metalloprotease [Acidobacteriota bacterium]
MSDNPLGGMFGDIFNLLGQQGPDAWFQTATQLALNIARGEDGDPNPQPIERQRIEELAPLVGRHVDALFEVAREPVVTAVNRSALTLAALAQWKPLIEPMIATPHPASTALDLEENQMMAQLMATIGPLFTGFQMGSVAGHFSERAWSLAVLPLPRLSDERLLVVNNLASFAEAWSLERDEVYVFALAQEFVASLVLTQPGTGDALRALLIDAVREASAAQSDIMTRLQTMINPEDLSSIMSNPEALLDGIELPEDTEATRAINAAASVLSAFFEHAAHQITTALLGPRPALVEAYKRHRRSDARGEDAAAALFGISTQGPHHDLAHDFVHSLSASHGLGVFDALLRVDGLPSHDELTDPDAWFQRVTTSPLA